MSSTIQVKITLSGIAANKLLYVLIIYPTNSGPEMLFLLLKALISISSPFSPVSSPTNSSQSDTLQVNSPLSCKTNRLMVYTGFSRWFNSTSGYHFVQDFLNQLFFAFAQQSHLRVVLKGYSKFLD